MSPAVALDKAAPAPTALHDAPALVRRSGEIPLATSLRFEYGHTALRAADTSAHDRATSGVAGANRGADIDAYDASLTWEFVRRGDFTLFPRAGVRAVRSAPVNRIEHGAAGDETETVASTIVGLSLRWDAAESFFLSAGVASPMLASDQSDAGGVLEYTAEGGFRLHHNVGFFLGYQRLRSAADDRLSDASRNDEGVMYARFVLRF